MIQINNTEVPLWRFLSHFRGYNIWVVESLEQCPKHKIWSPRDHKIILCMHYHFFFVIVTEFFNRRAYRGSVISHTWFQNNSIFVLIKCTDLVSLQILQFPRVWWFSLWLYPLWNTAGFTAGSHLCPSSQLAVAVNSEFLKSSSSWSPWRHSILLFTAGVRRTAASCAPQPSREQAGLCSLPILFHTSCFRPVPEGGHVAVFQQVLSLLHTGCWRLNPFGTCYRCKSLLHHLFQCLVTLKMLQSSSKCRRPWGHISRETITSSSYKIPLQRKLF